MAPQKRLRIPLLLMVSVVTGCDADPTPGQIERCRADAGVSLPEGTKVRSLYLEPSAFGVFACTTDCYRLLRDRNIAFVELQRPGGMDAVVDRLSFAPSGSAQCAPPFRRTANYYPPHRYQFRVPRGTCLVIDEQQQSRAEALLRERIIPSAIHPVTIREVLGRDGAALARIVDYRAPYIEVADVTCADVIPDFPRNSYKVILNHVTDAR